MNLKLIALLMLVTFGFGCLTCLGQQRVGLWIATAYSSTENSGHLHYGKTALVVNVASDSVKFWEVGKEDFQDRFKNGCKCIPEKDKFLLRCPDIGDAYMESTSDSTLVLDFGRVTFFLSKIKSSPLKLTKAVVEENLYHDFFTADLHGWQKDTVYFQATRIDVEYPPLIGVAVEVIQVEHTIFLLSSLQWELLPIVRINDREFVVEIFERQGRRQLTFSKIKLPGRKSRPVKLEVLQRQ